MFELFFSELRRKAFHVSGSLIPIIYYFISRETAVFYLAIINAVLLFIEWQRLSGKIKLPQMLLRPHEEKQVAAYIYFQIASLLSIVFFDKTIAIAAILMLALGDTASGLAGAMQREGNVRYSHNKIIIKPWPIMAIMFAVCLMIGLFLSDLTPSTDMVHISFAVFAAGAVGATIGDAIPLRIQGKPVDDNLMIPLLAGLFMSVARLL
jgi:dolichol kinase